MYRGNNSGFCWSVMGTVAGRRMSSKDICVLILGTMNTNTMFYKGRHSADVIKVKDFEDGKLNPDYADGPNLISFSALKVHKLPAVVRERGALFLLIQNTLG